MKRAKKILVLFLSLVMVLGLLPTVAMAKTEVHETAEVVSDTDNRTGDVYYAWKEFAPSNVELPEGYGNLDQQQFFIADFPVGDSHVIYTPGGNDLSLKVSATSGGKSVDVTGFISAYQVNSTYGTGIIPFVEGLGSNYYWQISSSEEAKQFYVMANDTKLYIGFALTSTIEADTEVTLTVTRTAAEGAGSNGTAVGSAASASYTFKENWKPSASEPEPTTTCVAQIGEDKYETLADAFAAVENGQTITLLGNLTQDDGVKFDKPGVSATLDLGGYTFTVNKGSNINNRAIRIDDGTLTVTHGSIVAVGSGTTSSNGAGCYGAFRVEADGKLIATNLTLTNSRPWGLNVKVLGGEAELTNVTINSSYGGGIEVTEADLGGHSKAGKATLTNCIFTQQNYFDHCSTAVSVSGGSELIVNSGSYTGERAMYVFSSGGVIKVNGGTFTGLGNDNRAAIVAAIDTTTYPAYIGGLEIKGGSVNGAFDITSPAYMSITGGIFSSDPTTYVATGYAALDNFDSETKAAYPYMVAKFEPAVNDTTSTNNEHVAVQEITYTDSTGSEKTAIVVTDKNEVNAVVVTTSAVDSSVTSNTLAKASDYVEVAQVLANFIETKNIAVADVTSIDMTLSLKQTEATTAENATIVAAIQNADKAFEIHPEATVVTKTGNTTSDPITYAVSNSELAENATFTTKLSFGAAAAYKYVTLTHYASDGTQKGDSWQAVADANGDVTVTLTSFSYIVGDVANATSQCAGYLAYTDADIRASLLWNVFFYIDTDVIATPLNAKIVVSSAYDEELDGTEYSLTAAANGRYKITVPIRHRLINQDVGFTLVYNNTEYNMKLGASGQEYLSVPYSFNAYLSGALQDHPEYAGVIAAVRAYADALLAKWPVDN